MRCTKSDRCMADAQQLGFVPRRGKGHDLSRIAEIATLSNSAISSMPQMDNRHVVGASVGFWLWLTVLAAVFKRELRSTNNKSPFSRSMHAGSFGLPNAVSEL